MSLRTRKQALLAKIETTYGTDAGPTGAANAMLVTGLEIVPLEGENVSRNLVRPHFGNDQQIPVGAHVSCTFKVEMAGAGAAGTAPAYGVLLRACAFAETVTPATEVVYDPVSEGIESVTLYIYKDGNLHKLLGWRGSVSMDLTAKQIPMLSFTGRGIWSDPVAGALPAADTTAFKAPVPGSKAHTPTITLHGIASPMETISIDLANQVVFRALVGAESVEITDRKPTGRIQIEDPGVAAKNYFTTAKAATLGALQLIHGTTAGNIVQIDAGNVQVLNPKYADSDGVQMLGMDLALVPSDAGDDEISITVK
ncbi:MAG: phage tail tube protein [Magnetospirillum sp. WYHS-4]